LQPLLPETVLLLFKGSLPQAPFARVKADKFKVMLRSYFKIHLVCNKIDLQVVLNNIIAPFLALSFFSGIHNV